MLFRRISRHSSNGNTRNSGRAWTHTVRGFPPTFNLNLGTFFAGTQPAVFSASRRLADISPDPRTNEPLSSSAMSPAEKDTGLRPR